MLNVTIKLTYPLIIPLVTNPRAPITATYNVSISFIVLCFSIQSFVPSKIKKGKVRTNEQEQKKYRKKT